MFKGHIFFVLLVFSSVASAAPAKDSPNDPNSSVKPSLTGLKSLFDFRGSADSKTEAGSSKPNKPFVITHNDWSFGGDDTEPSIDNSKSTSPKKSNSLLRDAVTLNWRNL
ncbi:hypothetical protein EV368DRAFT_81359 [Lentinula lateritia]|uniref:Uncharacterized protein n=1 Tax=Lentinula aff. lateritia TaxID=2804960 RepID=A0ACC1U3P7_9AGAR|nr:hypothetical protein F5876DRAFT_75586 [Lentinula aff. lateritia]KAJ3853686.1 hypothetical protein EV368DRAFT_81359 [Lentinula lateritia]